MFNHYILLKKAKGGAKGQSIAPYVCDRLRPIEHLAGLSEGVTPRGINPVLRDQECLSPVVIAGLIDVPIPLVRSCGRSTSTIGAYLSLTHS